MNARAHSLLTGEQYWKAAEQLYVKYIKPGAAHAVDLGDQLLAEVEAALEEVRESFTADTRETADPTSDDFSASPASCFTKAQATALRGLQYQFDTFKQSPLYSKYLLSVLAPGSIQPEDILFNET